VRQRRHHVHVRHVCTARVAAVVAAVAAATLAAAIATAGNAAADAKLVLGKPWSIV
jgi:hypothetical protein